MKNINVLVLSCIWLAIGLTAHAESVANKDATHFNLTEALKVVEETSPAIRKAEAMKDEARWKKTEAFSSFLPKVNAFGQHLVDNKFMVESISMGGPPVSIELIQPYTIWGVRADWVIFDGLANYDNYRAQTLAASATEKEADWTRFQVKQETKLKFFKAIAAVELGNVAAQNVKTLTDHLERAKALRKSGVGTNFDVLRVEVQLNEAQSEKLNTEDNVILAKQSLLNSLGLEDVGQSLNGNLPIPNSDKVAAVEKPTVMDRLDYQAITDRELSAHKAHLAAYKHFVPRFSVFGEADYYNNSSKGLADQDFKNAYTMGLSMSWNVFDGFASMAKSAQADARQNQAAETTRQAWLKNKYDFDFWKRRYLYSASLYKAKMDDVEKAQESVRLATQSFKAGTRTSSEVLDAELDLFRARAGVVNAQVSAAEALVNLELSVGKEF